MIMEIIEQVDEVVARKEVIELLEKKFKYYVETDMHDFDSAIFLRDIGILFGVVKKLMEDE